MLLKNCFEALKTSFFRQRAYFLKKTTLLRIKKSGAFVRKLRSFESKTPLFFRNACMLCIHLCGKRPVNRRKWVCRRSRIAGNSQSHCLRIVENEAKSMEFSKNPIHLFRGCPCGQGLTFVQSRCLNFFNRKLGFTFRQTPKPMLVAAFSNPGVGSTKFSSTSR